jgi:ABC-2 type transport system ATP-binding protein
MVMDADLTGRQYLEFVNNLHGGSFAAEIGRLSELLDADTDKRIGDYSRGNRQKIGLIASLLHRPKVLILDEPTSGFDPLIQERFAGLIREYVAGGGTVFMSSHILAEVQSLCDRIAFIRDGRIISTSSVHELLDSSAKRVEVSAPAAALRAVQSNYSKLPGLMLIENADKRLTFAYTGDIPSLLKFFADKRLTDITIREPELEEIFSRYYEGSPAETDNRQTEDGHAA